MTGHKSSDASDRKTISVVICNYNYGQFLAACVGSVKNQTRPADELIVVDDGSTDDSNEILALLPGLTRVIFQQNIGQRGAINSGYRVCSGDIVLFLDADDVLEPEALENIEREWEPNTSKLHFKMRLIDVNGRALGPIIPRTLANGDVSLSFREGRIFGSAPGSGNAYARATLDRLMPLPIDARDRHCADFFLIYGAAMVGSIKAVDRPLACYRIHSNQNTIYFGNARLDPDHATWERRGSELVSWLSARLGVQIMPPDVKHDFSAQKLRFASTMLEAPNYLARLRLAPQALRKLLPAIVGKQETKIGVKFLQLCWALFTIIAPLALVRPLAIRVCNPATR